MPPLPPPRPTGALRRAGLVAWFAAAILAGAFAGIYLAYESDLPQVSSLENFQPNIITEVLRRGRLAARQLLDRAARHRGLLRHPAGAAQRGGGGRGRGLLEAHRREHLARAERRHLQHAVGPQGPGVLDPDHAALARPLPDAEKTYERKVKEIILAFQIEKNFTKEEIFTLYCNQVYFGNGNYGVEATSQFLFDKSIKDLTLGEAALVAGLPQNPSRLSPVDSPEKALQRRNHVLQRMLEEKYISAEEAQRATAQPLALHLHKDPPSVAPYFLEEIRSTWSASTAASASTRAACASTRPLDPVMQHGATVALQEGCDGSTARRAGS
jgi:penicillin-binding protein 1A